MGVSLNFQSISWHSLFTNFSWLDETPTSRIITRCTQDIRAVDGPIAQWTITLTEFTITITSKLFVIVILSPVFLVPAVLVAGIGAWLANFYLKAQLSVKREMRYELACPPLVVCAYTRY